MRRTILIGFGSTLVLVFAVLVLIDHNRKPVSLQFETYSLASDIKSEKDYEDVVAAHRECFEETKRKNLTSFFQKYYGFSKRTAQRKADQRVESARASYSESLKRTSNLTVGRQGSGIVGIFNCVPNDDFSPAATMIYNVCVRSDERGKGFGSQLVKKAIESCRKPNSDLLLTVYKYESFVVDLYKRLGFKIISDLEDWDEDYNYYNKYLMKYQGPM